MPADQIRDILTDEKVKKFESNKDRLIAGLNDIVAGIERTNGEGKLLEAALRSTANYSSQKANSEAAIQSAKQMRAEAAALEAQVKQLNKAEQEELKTKKEVTRLSEARSKADKAETASLREKNKALRELVKEQERVANNLKKEEAQLARNQGAYAKLSAEYNTAARNAQNLAAQYGVEDKKAKDAAKSALDLHARLLQIDETIGRSQRNVGNYKSAYNGLGVSIQQVARELPNFAQNIQIGFMAISNNLPMLADEITKVRKSNAELVAQGKPTVSVFKQIAASIFSWQTAMVAAIAISVAYGKEIVNFFRGVTQATLDSEKANKKYKESIIEIGEATAGTIAKEITHLQTLNAVATDTNLTQAQRLEAAREMQRLYPARLGNLEQEAILEGRVNAEIKATIKSLIARANAAGAEDRLELTSKLLFTSEEKLQKARKDVTDYVAFLKKNTKVGITANSSIPDIFTALNDLSDPEAADAFTNELKKRVNGFNALKKATIDYTKEQKNYADQILNFTREQGDNLEGSPEGSIAALEDKMALLKEQERLAVVGGKAQLDITKQRIAAEDELAKAQLKGKYGRTPKTPKGNDLTNETIAAENNLTETLASIQEKRLEREARNNLAIYDDEKETLDKRLTALYTYENEKLAILDIGQASELEQVQNSLDKITEIEGKAVKDRTPEQKRLLLDKKVYEAQKLEIIADYADKETALINDVQVKQRKAASDNIKQQIATILQGAQDIENQVTESENRKLALLGTAKDAGLITENEYQKERKKIIDNANLDIFNAQQTYFKNYLEDLEKQGVITKEVLDRITKELSAERPSGAKGDKQHGIFFELVKSVFGDLDDAQVNQIVSAYTQAFNEIYNSIRTIIANKNAAIIEGLENEKDKLKENYDREVEYINTLYISDKERKEKLAVLSARNTLAELDQQRKINDAKRRAARAEKTANTAEAVGKTAIAVLSALSVKPWYLGLALSVAAGITGAAQIAAIQSTPLPQYAKGRGFGKAEFARVNEQGAEAIVSKSGQVRIANAGADGVTWLGADEKVLTATNTKKIMDNAITRPIQDRQAQHVQDSFAAQVYEKVGKKIVEAVKSSRSVTNVIVHDKSYIDRITKH